MFRVYSVGWSFYLIKTGDLLLAKMLEFKILVIGEVFCSNSEEVVCLEWFGIGFV